MDGLKWGLLVGFLGLANQAQAEVLVGSAYQNAVASSSYNASYLVGNLFDSNTTTQWAIAGATGGNPQGQGQGWVSFNLDKAYTINSIWFAARSTDPTIAGLNTLNVWIGTSAFNVNVQSKTGTNGTDAFLTSNPTPTWVQNGGFATTNTEYILPAPVYGQYFVVEFVQTNPNVAAANVGGANFLVNVAVPEPGTLLLGGIATVSGGAGVWWRRKRQPAQVEVGPELQTV